MSVSDTDVQAIQLKNAAVQLGERTVWHQATMSIAEGEFIGVLGPNGSGKTTLLKLLLGLLPASEGEVRVLGESPQRGNRLIGYVPQRRTLDPDMPVRGRDLVTLGMEGGKWGFSLPGASHRQKLVVDAAVQSVQATAYADRPIGHMSGGEQQRLLLAQALVGKPRLLLLDEPLANLDLRNQEAITQLVARLARAERITVLLVTHDINPLLAVMDRVVYIAQGRVSIGTTNEIITSETLSILYGAPVQVVRDDRGRYLCSGTIS